MRVDAVGNDEREEYFFRRESIRPCVPFPEMEFFSNPPPKLTQSIAVIVLEQNKADIMLCKRHKRDKWVTLKCEDPGIKNHGKAVKHLGEHLVHEVKKGAEKVNDWVQEHKKEVIIGALVAAVVIGAILVGPEALALLGLTPQDKGEPDSTPSNSPAQPPEGPSSNDISNLPQLNFQSSDDFLASIAQADPKVYYDLFPLPGQSQSDAPLISPYWVNPPAKQESPLALVDPDGPVRVYNIPPLPANSSQMFVVEGKQRRDQLIVGGTGMNTSSTEAQGRGVYLSNLSDGSKVTVVYSSCGPILFDTFYTVGQAVNVTPPDTVAYYQELLEQFHTDNQDNPNAKCFLNPHSRGTIPLRKALENSPPEVRDRVIVVAIAPAVIIPDELCFQSFNYASKNDPVPHLLHNYLHSSLTNVADEGIADLKPFLTALEKEQEQLILLDPHPDGSYFGHAYEDPIFEKALKHHLKEYLEESPNMTPYGAEK